MTPTPDILTSSCGRQVRLYLACRSGLAQYGIEIDGRTVGGLSRTSAILNGRRWQSWRHGTAAERQDWGTLPAVRTRQQALDQFIEQLITKETSS